MPWYAQKTVTLKLDRVYIVMISNTEATVCLSYIRLYTIYTQAKYSSFKYITPKYLYSVDTTYYIWTTIEENIIFVQYMYIHV